MDSWSFLAFPTLMGRRKSDRKAFRFHSIPTPQLDTTAQDLSQIVPHPRFGVIFISLFILDLDQKVFSFHCSLLEMSEPDFLFTSQTFNIDSWGGHCSPVSPLLRHWQPPHNHPWCSPGREAMGPLLQPGTDYKHFFKVIEQKTVLLFMVSAMVWRI